MADFIERELGWDDEIERESEFILLPEGDYNFTVESFERGRFDGSDKMPPCPMAILNLRVTGAEGSTTIQHRLFLHTKSEWALSAFFKSIGQKQTGEKVRMNWNAVPGAKGRCHIGIREYMGTDGEMRKTNQVKRFLEGAPVQQSKPTMPW